MYAYASTHTHTDTRTHTNTNTRTETHTQTHEHTHTYPVHGTWDLFINVYVSNGEDHLSSVDYQISKRIHQSLSVSLKDPRELLFSVDSPNR